jgi:hypothetical protein
LFCIARVKAIIVVVNSLLRCVVARWVLFIAINCLLARKLCGYLAWYYFCSSHFRVVFSPDQAQNSRLRKILLPDPAFGVMIFSLREHARVKKTIRRFYFGDAN